MTTFERENIRKMAGYVPGEQPESTDVVKLNTNENPYPPVDAVMDALRGIEPEMLRRYPPPTALRFREVAARAHGVAPENVIAVNGGDELLRLAMTTFVEPGQPIGIAQPSYGLYPILAAIQDSPVVRVPLEDDWSLPRDFAARMNEANAKLVIITNPHAPSGYLTATERLAEIAGDFNGVVLVDEAYADFVDPELHYDSIQLIRPFSNVLILRSLSKGYSLAGLRFGYGLAAETLIDPMLGKTKDSYNVDAVSQRLATAALENRDKVSETWRAVREERERMRSRLQSLGFACPSSQSNFVLAEAPAGIAGGASGIYEALKNRRIFVRYFDEDRLHDKLRITVGKPEENDALFAALQELARPAKRV